MIKKKPKKNKIFLSVLPNRDSGSFKLDGPHGTLPATFSLSKEYKGILSETKDSIILRQTSYAHKESTQNHRILEFESFQDTTTTYGWDEYDISTWMTPKTFSREKPQSLYGSPLTTCSYSLINPSMQCFLKTNQPMGDQRNVSLFLFESENSL